MLREKKNNFHLTGNPDTGDCSLTINDANTQDTGMYRFKIEDGNDERLKWNYKDNLLYVTVTEADIDGNDTESCPIHVTDVMVQEGLCVSIPCFIADNGKLSGHVTIYWRKQNPGNTYTETDNTGCYSIVATNDKSINPSSKIQKVHLTRDLSNGDCSLTINDAKKEDAGRYQFRIEDTGFRRSYRDKYLNLQVTELESPNMILPEKLVAGVSQRMTCRQPGLPECPETEAKISWKTSKTSYQVTYKNISKESSITFIPSKDDHQTSITCKMTLPGGKSSNKSVNLTVEYAPSVSVTGESSGKHFNDSKSVTVSEGDNVTLRCSVDSNPPANVTWRKGEESEYMSRGQVLVVFSKISRQQSGTYTCLAVNEHGNDSVTFHVTVSHGKLMHSALIAGIVFGNIFFLIMMGLGLYYYMKRSMEKKRSKRSDDGKQDIELYSNAAEPLYQGLKGPGEDPYSTIDSVK